MSKSGDIRAEELLTRLKQKVNEGFYTIKSHVLRHSFEGGFNESQLREAFQSAGILEMYEEGKRCLLCGEFSWTETTREHLHIVVDFGDPNWVDIVTAYIPRRPEWIDPFQRGEK